MKHSSNKEQSLVKERRERGSKLLKKIMWLVSMWFHPNNGSLPQYVAVMMPMFLTFSCVDTC